MQQQTIQQKIANQEGGKGEGHNSNNKSPARQLQFVNLLFIIFLPIWDKRTFSCYYIESQQTLINP